MWHVLLSAALAADAVPVPFQPADAIPLPARVGYVSHRLASDASTCEAAAAEAVSALQAAATKAGLPHLVRIVGERGGRDPAPTATCRDRFAGKEVIGKSIEIVALAVAGPTDGPTLTADDAVALIWALTDLVGGDPADVALATADGKPALRTAKDADLGVTGLDLAGRAGWVITEHVLPVLPTWSQALASYPQVAAFEVEVGLKSKNPLDPKERRAERFRVVVDREAASAFARGELTEQELAARAAVHFRPTPKTEVEVALTVDLDAADGPVAAPVERKQRALDVGEDDIEGLTDEE